MKSAELRQRFLDYFRRNGHEIVPSSPLVPANDPTLLFTNAGMVQFKDVFLGLDPRPYKRAASSQRCVRAGGKHNDLENVGYTARHHTFFEMLGNFSFGDYFKREAIAYAWELITGELAIPRDRLWVTVYEDDDEAERLWREVTGIEPARITRRGARDNFWSMGDTGPCGPCTEIFYDHGPGVPGGPPGSPDEDGDRYVEIWNLVFMQFDRAADGAMTPLPKPSVDTGMGLERIAAVMQGVHSNYDIDLFRNLIAAAAEVTGAQDLQSSSLRVIADHIRACAFLVADGVVPSNEGRGYVLRRIIRRAIRHGYKLGQHEPFFYRLVGALEAEMGAAYPELGRQRAHVERVLRQEEERFAETLDQGMRMLDAATAGLSGGTIPGDVVFKLYDTYGFPTDLTADIARERGFTVDIAGFEKAMTEQRERARAASKFAVEYGAGIRVDERTEFTGYERLTDTGRVVALLKGEHRVDFLTPGEEGVVVLDRTPFYAESGGQVGDTGVLRSQATEFAVHDTRKFGRAYGHVGMLIGPGELRVGDYLDAAVDAVRRQATMLNHTATHLLHAALRRTLGEHVQQKGSLVAPDRLRFDFSHYEPLTPAQLVEIEALVNAQIRANAEADIREMAYDEAIAAGALAFFGEKYEQRVRVLRVGDFSTELCGGTHVRRAGDIGLFKITSESGIAAGVRRIEAVTGQAALDWVERMEGSLRKVAGLVKASRDEVDEKVQQLVERNRALERELQQLKARLAGSRGEDLTARAVDVKGVKVLAARLDEADPKVLRETVDRLKAKLGSAVVVLSAVEDGKVRLAAGVSADRTDRVKAGELVSAVAQRVGGRGGGRADFAQAGGTEPDKLEEALASVPAWVAERL
jgi:alanyl-tRNA synthetase